MADCKPEAMKWKPYFHVVALQPEGKIKKWVVPTVTHVVESPGKYNQLNLRRRDMKEKLNFEVVFKIGISQRLLNRWTSQLDLGCTTGCLERVVSVHNST